MTTAEKPTDILRGEHRSVLQKLDTLEELIGRLGQREVIATRLSEMSSFFNTDFWTHFAKEEKALFPELEKFIPREAGPVGVMLMEHDDLRKTNEEMQRAVGEYLGVLDNSETRAAIQNLGTRFITVLRDHIHKEDNMLFMMAEMHLDEGQVRNVMELFKKIETSGVKPLQT